MALKIDNTTHVCTSDGWRRGSWETVSVAFNSFFLFFSFKQVNALNTAPDLSIWFTIMLFFIIIIFSFHLSTKIRLMPAWLDLTHACRAIMQAGRGVRTTYISIHVCSCHKIVRSTEELYCRLHALFCYLLLFFLNKDNIT